MFELKEAIQTLRNGDHSCLFYENEPAQQFAALISFIQEGLSRDEQVVYIAGDRMAGELARGWSRMDWTSAESLNEKR